MLLMVGGSPTLVKRGILPLFNEGLFTLPATITPDTYGGLITTLSRHTGQVYHDLGLSWAMDNGCFKGLDTEAYVKMLDRNAGIPGCLFAVVPDVYQGLPTDAIKTINQYRIWSSQVREYGYKVALVAQIGLTREIMRPWWAKVDCLFIGGNTEWKLGPQALELVREAKERGKWVHMGRVNTCNRLALAASFGCDSVDGTGYIRFSRRDLPGMARQVKAINRNQDFYLKNARPLLPPNVIEFKQLRLEEDYVNNSQRVRRLSRAL